MIRDALILAFGDDEVLALWRQGKDTYDIAATLQVPEHVIERRLHAALAVVRSSLNETSAAGAGRAGRLEPATRNSGAPAAPSLAREHLSG